MSESSRFEDFQDGCMLTLKVNINNTLMVRTHSHGCVKKHRNKILYPLSRPRMQCFYFQITRKIKHVVYITKPFNTIIESEEFLFRASCAPHIDIHLS
jgi:hypothetical protein